MLRNIPAILAPDLLHTLRAMGHGDEIVIADANFPGASLGPRLHRLDGVPATTTLAAILSLMPTFLFSGFLQPVSSLEGGARVIGTLWPTTYYMHMSVGVFTKGLSCLLRRQQTTWRHWISQDTCCCAARWFRDPQTTFWS